MNAEDIVWMVAQNKVRYECDKRAYSKLERELQAQYGVQYRVQLLARSGDHLRCIGKSSHLVARSEQLLCIADHMCFITLCQPQHYEWQWFAQEYLAYPKIMRLFLVLPGDALAGEFALCRTGQLCKRYPRQDGGVLWVPYPASVLGKVDLGVTRWLHATEDALRSLRTTAAV